MVKPLCRNLPATAVFHRFSYIITDSLSKQTVNPYTYFILFLFFELSLPVYRPAKQPWRILAAHNSASDNFPWAWISLAYLLYIWNYLFIRCCNGCRFPFWLFNIRTKFFRISKCHVLPCDIFPKTPTAAFSYLCTTCRCVFMVAVYCTFRAASVCDKNKVIICKFYFFIFARHYTLNSFRCLFLSVNVKYNICYLSVKFKWNTCIFKIFKHRHYKWFILVVSCKF